MKSILPCGGTLLLRMGRFSLAMVAIMCVLLALAAAPGMTAEEASKLPQGYQIRQIRQFIPWRANPSELPFLEKAPGSENGWRVKVPADLGRDLELRAAYAEASRIALVFDSGGFSEATALRKLNHASDAKEIFKNLRSLYGKPKSESDRSCEWRQGNTHLRVTVVSHVDASGERQLQLEEHWKYIP